VGAATEVEEAEVGHQPAAHHLIGRHGGIETAGHQYQGLLQRTQRVAADTVVLSMNDEQALVADFHPHFDFRRLQRNACRAALLAQAAADMALHVHRAEGVLAGALAAHCEYLARQAAGEVRLALLEDVIQIAQRILVHFEAMGDARRAAQAFDHLAQNLRVAERRLHLDVVPHPFHPQFGIHRRLRSRSTVRMFFAS